LKLWIDDERPMPDGFDLHAKTYFAAIDFLQKRKVSFVSFDHDLGESKTGYDVACWIEEAVIFKKFKRIGWDIHSMNPVGSRRIKVVMLKLDGEWDRMEGIKLSTSE
jgi:hypothetical protein